MSRRLQSRRGRRLQCREVHVALQTRRREVEVLMGAWQNVIKPRLLELRSRRSDLKEDYYQGQNTYCKCGNIIVKAGNPLPFFTQIELHLSNTVHLTPCC